MSGYQSTADMINNELDQFQDTMNPSIDMLMAEMNPNLENNKDTNTADFSGHGNTAI